MTEPVAYMLSDFVGNDFTSLELPKNPNNPRGLYFKEQLQPCVKMTQAEFDEFKRLFEYVDYASIATATIANVGDDFNKLEERICSGNVDERIKKQNEFNVLWANYNPDNPEGTIEIVPDMKWFVRSKERVMGLYMFLSNLTTLRDPYCFTKQDNFTSFSHQFDTKEEAERWTNPLTEAVQLPVEGE